MRLKAPLLLTTTIWVHETSSITLQISACLIASSTSRSKHTSYLTYFSGRRFLTESTPCLYDFTACNKKWPRYSPDLPSSPGQTSALCLTWTAHWKTSMRATMGPFCDPTLSIRPKEGMQPPTWARSRETSKMACPICPSISSERSPSPSVTSPQIATARPT